MPSPSRKKSRPPSAGAAMQVAAMPEPALAYAARDSFAFTEAAPAESAPPAALPEPVTPAMARPSNGSSAVVFDSQQALQMFGGTPVEAVAEAGAILAKGMEAIGQSVVDLGQRQLASSVELAKATFGTTTLRQLVELHTGFARASFERWMEEGTRMSEISMKTADAAFQPLKLRVAQAMEKLTSAAA